MTLDEALTKLRAVARTLRQEKTEATGNEFERVYVELQSQLTHEESNQLFYALMNLYVEDNI